MAEESRDLATIIGDTLNVVRGGLAHVNLDLPMVLAQVLALLVVIVAFVAWWRIARRGPGRWKMYFARLTLVVAGMIGLGVLYAWYDYWRLPLARQVVVRLSADPPAPPHAELIDYADNVVSAGASFYDDLSRELLLSYEPEFADPPRLRLRVPGCATQELRLARVHLRQGESMPVTLDCGGST